MPSLGPQPPITITEEAIQEIAKGFAIFHDIAHGMESIIRSGLSHDSGEASTDLM